MGECVGAGGRCRAETVSFRGVPEHETRDADARLEEYRVSESQKIYANRAQGQNEASALRQHCSAIVGGQDEKQRAHFTFSFLFCFPLIFAPFLLWGFIFSCGRERHQLLPNDRKASCLLRWSSRRTRIMPASAGRGNRFTHLLSFSLM